MKLAFNECHRELGALQREYKNVPKGTSMLPLSGVALHHGVEGVKQVPNGTNSNTYRLMVSMDDDGEEECVELTMMMILYDG